MDQQSLEFAGVVVAALSAVATGVSAAVVAVQARHTRESAEASKAAVQVSNETLREAQVARLDTLAPHIFIEHPDFILDDPFALVEKEAVAPVDGVFRMPRDKAWKIGVNISVKITNEGSRSVPLKFSSPFTPDAQSWGLQQVTLKPGQEYNGIFKVVKPLSEWVALATSTKVLERCFTGEIAYIGPGDSDVSEYHRIDTFGTVVRPVQNQDGAWQLVGLFDNKFAISSQPLERVYWKSRGRNEKF